MIKKFTFIFATLILMSGQAFAAGLAQHTEFFYQPEDGRKTVQLGYNVASSISWAAQGLVPSGSGTLAYIPFQADYSFLNNYTVEVSTFFGTRTVNVSGLSSQTSSGMADAHLTLKGAAPMDFVDVRYGLDFGINNGNAKQPGSANGNSGNLTSGGMSLNPYLGAILPFGMWSIGTKMTYNYLLNQSVDPGNGTGVQTYAGGNVFDIRGFLEMTNDEWMFRAFFGSQSVAAQTNTQGGATVSSSYNPSVWGIGLDYSFNDNFTVLGDYVSTNNISQSTGGVTVSGISSSTFTVTARYLF